VVYLQKFDGFTNSLAAFYCSMMWLGLAIASPILGIIMTKVKRLSWPLAISAIIGAAAFLCLILLHMQGVRLITVLLVAGAACSGQALSFYLVEINNIKIFRSTAIAVNNMAVVSSGFIFQPVIGAVINNLGKHNYLSHTVTDYRRGLYLIFFAYLMAFLVALTKIKNPVAANID